MKIKKIFFSQESKAKSINDLVNKASGLSKTDKDAIFQYAVNPANQQLQSKKEYITNLIVLMNSIFEYGFLKRSGSHYDRDNTFSDDDEEDEEDNEDYDNEFDHDMGGPAFKHYWDYITVNFSTLNSVRYINFYYEEATDHNQRALGWLMLAINEPDELYQVFLESFCNTSILSLYKKEEAYFWLNRREVLEMVKSLKSRKEELYMQSKLIDNYRAHMAQKQE
jgi:hypothetical protein